MIQNIKLSHISPSKTNPRKRFDENELAQLADNIKLHGVLQPILVRMNGGGSGDCPVAHYELVAGERRYRAAKLAGKEDIPAIVRELDDWQVLEIQVIENMQRSDLHPLEEAEGYRSLLLTKQYDVARIAEKVGRSVRYVYDRVKLLELIPEIKEHFLTGLITAGHAVLLARLTPVQQEKALGGRGGDRWERGDGLFQWENSLFDEDKDDEKAPRHKAVSVKELERWIATHVKFDRANVDPMLFPETAEMIAEATEQKAKIIPITRSYRSSDDIRKAGKERIYGEQAWTRADGLEKSKECEYSVLGVIVDGVGYGEAFAVCVNKEKCTVHWAAEVKHKATLAKARAAGDTKTVAKAEKKAAKQEQSWELQARVRKEETARIKKVRPHILAALLPAIKAAKVAPGTPVWELAEDDLYIKPDVKKEYGAIKAAEDLMRAYAFGRIMPNGFGDTIADTAKDLKPFGIDLQKLLDEHAPVEKPKAPAKKKPARKKAKR